MAFRYLFMLLLLLLPWTAVPALELRVEVSGLEDELEENVLLFLDIERERKSEGLTPSRVRYLHRQAPGQIRLALRPYGYFRPQVDPELKETEKGFVASYRVDAGPPVRLGTVDFRVEGAGRDDPLFAQGFPLKPGDVLNQPEYDAAKQSLLTTSVESGYLKARYSGHRLTVDLDAYRADIRLELQTGPRFQVGDIRFHQDVLDPDFLARYLPFREGDPFSHEKLLSLQSRLIDSDYFEQVEVRPALDQAEGERVPVDITLTPNKPNRYRAGIGFATDTGPRVTLDWQRRWIGRRGHRALSELVLSPAHSKLKLEYIIPLEDPTKDALSFSAGADHYDTDSRKGERITLSGAHSVGLDDDWRRTLALDYAYEDFELADNPGTTRHLIPSVSWSHRRSDGKPFILRGHKVDYRLEGAVQQLLSDSSYLQGHAKTKSIFGLGENWRILARLELGASLASGLDDLPATRRFFAGGDNSVRGYGLDALGPTDSGGEVVGGRYLAVGSLELERVLHGKWSAALFYDAGNAFDPEYANELAQGAGFGVRWRSPVGPVRLDLANALSRDGNAWRIHVVMGPEL